MKKRKNRVEMPGGLPCPKCGNSMKRFGHNMDWKPKVNQPYYFMYWDMCKPCRHIQLYEAAKIMTSALAVKEQLRQVDYGRFRGKR